jgi:dolichyl-phosphate beta-glucosyltransferase
MMIFFHSLVYVFTIRSIKDTQCGFKLFTRSAAAELFPRIHVERWAFDIELLYLAELMRIPIKEVGVEWKEIDGSKINPFQASFEMGRDIILVWFRYLFGIWKI